MIHLAIPVMDQHALTMECLAQLNVSTEDPKNLHVILVDNASEVPYEPPQDCAFRVTLIRNEINRGYYWPLLQAAEFATLADIVGLMHNDLLIYGPGWDQRLVETFVSIPDLGLVGMCGSNEVDERGGRGGGTMCNFRGDRGARCEDTGRRATGVSPALILDSLFMATRAICVPLLEIDDGIVPCHFVDKIWPLRLWTKQWKTAVLGVECDHMGGQTAVANPRFAQDCERWCREHGIDPGDNAALAVYLEAERRFLDEFRPKGLIPSRLGSTWQIS